MDNEIIKLKGTGNGVKIFLSKNEPFGDIIKALYGKLDEFRKFFGDGRCNIYFVGRELTKEDKLRLESVTSAMMPKSTVCYEEKKSIFQRKKETQTDEEEHDKRLEEVNSFVEERVRQRQEAIERNFKQNRARYFEGDVSEGRILHSDGHLILKGDVKQGAAVSASGNVIVLGRLMGSAHAGNMGSNDAYILALGFMPQHLRIAQVCMDYDDYEEMTAKIALCDGKRIFVEKFDINQ